MSENDRIFWTEQSRYHDLAKTFEEHIEREHPDAARGCFCSDKCPFAATAITYYSYNGPRVTAL